MSKNKVNIKGNVMEQIKENKISMKPKSYFVIGSALLIMGLISSVLVSVFVFSLLSFISRSHGPMGQYRLEQMIATFPWWILILGVISLISSLLIFRKSDLSYKRNFVLITIVFIVAVVIAGFLIDLTGLDNLWLRQGPMKGVMRQYIEDNNLEQKPGFYYQNGNIDGSRGRGTGNGQGRNRY